MLYDPDDIINHFALVGRNGNKPIVRHGTQLSSCCPFWHFTPDKGKYKESNPSFGVDLETGAFNCFSCGKAGRSLEQLAWKLDAEIPVFFKTYTAPKVESYVDSIENYSPDFLSINKEIAIRYFDSRNIFDVVDEYGIGASSDGTVVYVPIYDKSGKFIAWSEKNTINNTWYLKPDGVSKGFMLFGAHEKFGKMGYVLESVSDKLKMSSWGYDCVATCSANVTPTQIDAIADLFDYIVMVPQNDYPADNWAKKIVSSLVDRILVYVLKLPKEYKDVAEIKDKKTFEELIPRTRMVKGVNKTYGSY